MKEFTGIHATEVEAAARHLCGVNKTYVSNRDFKLFMLNVAHNSFNAQTVADIALCLEYMLEDLEYAQKVQQNHWS